jgi:phosphatidylserine/phosphatidylglycerophosphate/cardiolipin synthase-like enzyme
MSLRKVSAQLFASVLLLFLIPSASATERLCDVSFEDCRAPLLQLIKNENQEIDAAFWFMDDVYIESALIAAQNRGVSVRMLVDQRSFEGHPSGTAALKCFAGLGPCPITLTSGHFPMRQRVANGILHWKMMLFSGQGVVEFSGANYSKPEFVTGTPYQNYVDEAIYYCDDPALVNSFRTMYDNWWVGSTGNFAKSFTDYVNPVTPLLPSYAVYPIENEACTSVPNGCGLDFLPSPAWQDNYGTKVESAINAERMKLDVDMFRITNGMSPTGGNPGITDSTIAAFKRGLPIRMIVDLSEYRNTARVWDRYNVDRLFMAGVPLKITKHAGQNHEKSVLFYGQAMTVWGSSNWTQPSFNIQQEHNYFSTSPFKPWFFQWFVNQFERRWNSPQEYQAFVPMGPTAPVYESPGNGATGQNQNLTLTWDGGPWGQMYDIYLGTKSTPPLIASNVVTGNPDPVSHQFGTFQISGLAPNTTYWWKIVSKTMAGLPAAGSPISFTTGGTSPSSGVTVNSVCANGSCNPASGPPGGGTPVTITGTNFGNGGATVSFGFATATVTGNTDTTITATAPPHIAGLVNVTVTNQSGQSGSLAGGFLYTAPPLPGSPRLNVVVPDTSYQGGGDVVTIAGSNLVAGATVCFMVGGNCVQVTPMSPSSACLASVCIRATAPAESGGTIANIVVTTPSGSSNSLQFKYLDSPVAPNITTISPLSGSMNGGTRVVISGGGFRYGALVTFGGPPKALAGTGTPGTPATTITVTNSATVCGSGVPLPCIIATTPPFAIGATDVVVTNLDPFTGTISPPNGSDPGSGMSTLTGGYTFVKAPSITNVVPSTGSVSGGTQITISGANFETGAMVVVGNQPPVQPTATSSNSISAMTPAGTAGTAALAVVNPDGQSSNTLIFTYK